MAGTPAPDFVCLSAMLILIFKRDICMSATLRFAGFSRLRSTAIVRFWRKPTAFICTSANTITSKISSLGNPCKQVSSLDIDAMTIG